MSDHKPSSPTPGPLVGTPATRSECTPGKRGAFSAHFPYHYRHRALAQALTSKILNPEAEPNISL